MVAIESLVTQGMMQRQQKAIDIQILCSFQKSNLEISFFGDV